MLFISCVEALEGVVCSMEVVALVAVIAAIIVAARIKELKL